MIRTAARLAAIAALGLAAAPAANADAYKVTMTDVVVSSYQTSGPQSAPRMDLSGTPQSPQLLPAVQKVRESAARCSCS